MQTGEPVNFESTIMVAICTKLLFVRPAGENDRARPLHDTMNEIAARALSSWLSFLCG